MNTNIESRPHINIINNVLTDNAQDQLKIDNNKPMIKNQLLNLQQKNFILL